MMLNRLSQMLVIRTVTSAITNPMSIPRCTLAHVNAKCNARRLLDGPWFCRREATAMMSRPSPSPAKVPAIADATA